MSGHDKQIEGWTWVTNFNCEDDILEKYRLALELYKMQYGDGDIRIFNDAYDNIGKRVFYLYALYIAEEMGENEFWSCMNEAEQYWNDSSDRKFVEFITKQDMAIQ
jgi:hypothetical protein